MSPGIQMATTQAVFSVREQSVPRSPSEPVTRQALNLRQLVQIIRGPPLDVSDRSMKSGVKRSATHVMSSSRKRAKVETPSGSWRALPEANTEAERILPAYSHRFEIGYTTNWKSGEAGVGNSQQRYANDERANELGWLLEEKQLLSAFANGDITSPRTFELGDVTLEDHWGVMQLYIGSGPEHDDDEHYNRYLLTLPSYGFPDYLRFDPPGNVLNTCSSLQRAGHISMSASASIFYIPGIAAPELPIQLHVNVYISLIVPTIFSPPSIHAYSTNLNEERRRFLLYLFYRNSTDIGNGIQEKDGPKELRHFYSIIEPASSISSLVIYDSLQPQGLHASLLPFQRRTVKWLLERERMTIDSRGRIVPHSEDPETLPLFWRRVDTLFTAANATDASTGRLYYNPITGSFSEKVPPPDNIFGAMLCEEMGLGKTLECIALMLLNPGTDRNPTNTRWDPVTELEISQVKTNLIVTPSTLSQQWLDELSRHAPSLKVFAYNGYNKVKLPNGSNTDDEGGAVGKDKTHRTWCSYIQGFDVIVTTYKVLSQELRVAKAPFVRPKRKMASYSHVEKPRSPLVRVEWARVFMDEVQLVGGGKTAEMVSLIPRDVSIAVSGTPAKSKVSDLFHVLKFLRIEPAIGSRRIWEDLLKPEFNELFSELFKKYAVRTLKSSVKDELTIPSQGRFAVGIEMGKAERHIYDLTLQEALDELGVDDRGIAVSQTGQLDITLLRSWLRRLRQVCTHPQVAIVKSNKAAAKSINSKTIKTIEEVLQGYQEQNWNLLVTETKNKIQIRVRRAQLVQVAEHSNRYQQARDLLLSAQTEVEQLLDDVKAAIAAHEVRGKGIIQEAAIRRMERKKFCENQDVTMATSKGKEKAQYIDSSDEDESEYDGLPRTQLGDDHRSRQRGLQARLREVYVLQHKIAFLLGDVYHILGLTLQEEALYATAEVIRKTLLKSTEESASSAMAKLNPKGRAALKKDLKLWLCQKGGVQSADLLEEANEVLELLDDQGELLCEWHARITTLLTQKFTSGKGDQADGEEYARALDTQGEAEAYLEAYAALIADRKEVLIAERTALATHDARETKLRETQAARKANEAIYVDGIGDLEPLEDLDNEALKLELAEERKSLKTHRSPRALKAIMFQLSEVGNRPGNRLEENSIVKQEVKSLRTMISEQGMVMEKFELELASFRKVFNERIQYFKQLQELSDSVVQPQWDGNIEDAIKSSEIDEGKTTFLVNTKRARQRHFNNIVKDRAEGDMEEEDCVLCESPFQRGLMTPCGHIFCESCLTGWLKTRKGRSSVDCPMCRSRIEVDALQRISLKDEDYQKQLEKRGEPKSRSRQSKFNKLPQRTLDEIETFEVLGSYGSKITHLIRHLRYLQNQEPGTKSVVFSAWSDSLTIIQNALMHNGISSIRVDQKGKKDAAQRFKTDPGLSVFLLHGERENAGLNLTCAKRVWLIEPTVNHAFEVQAISRVDRMGQTSATEVFCFYVQDSVEENILQMSARRGLSLYTEDHSREAIDISEFAMGSQKVPVDSPSKKEKQKGDFIAQAEDLIHVLFPHLDSRQEDLANLEDAPGSNQAKDREYAVDGPPTNGSGQVNAVAGPSRLH